MCAKWRSEYDPQLILDKLAPDVSIDKKGNVGFGILSYHQKYSPILVSAIDFHPDIPDIHKPGIISMGIQKAKKRGKLTKVAVRSAISKAERDFLNKKSDDFVLATSISLRKMPSFRQIAVNGRSITLSKKLPRKFDRTSAEKRFSIYSAVPPPTDYLAVRLDSSGRTAAEAAEKALNTLSLLMGIWNFVLTKGSFTFSLSGAQTGPIADLSLGPVHTLHRPDGKLAIETIWYEPSYIKPAPLKDYSKKLDGLRKRGRWILRQTRKANNVESIRSAFTRYASAVNEPSLETAFLRFWGLLEHLTDTRKDSYDTTVRRAAFIYRDHEIARQELQHLRHVRNGLVHLGESSNAPQAHVYQLKNYVDDLLLFLLKDANIKRNRDELKAFLDLPPAVDKLKIKSDLLQRAIAFRRP